MSFMTFPFEQPYQKLLENFEGSNFKKFNTDDAQTIGTGKEHNEQLGSSGCKEMSKEAIGSKEQIDEETIEYLKFDSNVEQSKPVDKLHTDNRCYNDTYRMDHMDRLLNFYPISPTVQP
ncbi:uncharacterized protein LOC105692906 [Athalia rosae]|uniref:uncharacterized protein LOC105692906 n=1 Tax=Athalia rosae TaxID=37344 RepID=UPI00203497AC|nr:uncharacterized protein LOC105692906 [Athalia rosae]